MTRIPWWLPFRWAALGLVGWLALGLVAGLVLAASSAQATPVTVYFNDNSVGIDNSLIPGLELVLDPTPPQIDAFLDLDGTLFSYGIPNPIPGDPTGTSRSDPATGSNTWSFTALTQNWDNLWILFTGPDFPNPADSTDQNNFYLPENVGLELDSDTWGLYQVPNTDVYYAAFRVGNIIQDFAIDIPIEHRVAQNLFDAGENFLMPRHAVGYLTTVSVPEPSTVVLLAGGALAVLAVARRRSC
jgi:hypothetical protein